MIVNPISGLKKVLVATVLAVPLAGCTENKKEEKNTTVQQTVPQNPHSGNDIKKTENDFEELLKTTGVKGLVHGSVPNSEMFVFVYGDPIQGGVHYSLIPSNNKIKTKLETTARHQSVIIKGELLNKGTPQQHILLEDIKRGEKWKPEVAFKYTNPKYYSPEELKENLKDKNEINCVVHAVLHGGKVLIVNHNENVIPVHVTDPKWTKDLRSSDKIKLRYKIREHDQGPLHLSLRTEKDIAPIEVIDSILKLSDSKEKYKLEGSLVWFPKSPVLIRDVWGLRVKDSNGLVRTYSLYNLRDKEDVEKISTTLKEAWQKKNDGFVFSSSYFYHPDIKIEVTGDIVHFVQNQRNPLIDLDSKDIKVLP